MICMRSRHIVKECVDRDIDSDRVWVCRSRQKEAMSEMQRLHAISVCLVRCGMRACEGTQAGLLRACVFAQWHTAWECSIAVKSVPWKSNVAPNWKRNYISLPYFQYKRNFSLSWLTFCGHFFVLLKPKSLRSSFPCLLPMMLKSPVQAALLCRWLTLHTFLCARAPRPQYFSLLNKRKNEMLKMK